MKMVAEGVSTARSAKDCADQFAITTPIINEVNSILYEHASPAAAMEALAGAGKRRQIVQADYLSKAE